jgi:hypothetical protein
MNTRKIYLGIWIFAIVAGLIAVAITEINRAERDDAGEIAKEGELEVAEFRVGDCLLSLDLSPDPNSDGDLVNSGGAVPCDLPHEYQIYAKTLLPQNTAHSPALEDISYEYCENQFEPYFNSEYFETELEIQTIYPSKESHAAGDREVLCLISEFGENQSLTRPLKGKGPEYPLVSDAGYPLLLDLIGTPIGQCLNFVEDEYIGAAIENVPCDVPHEYELFFNARIAADGEGELAEISEQRCIEEFEAYIGKPWLESEFTFIYLNPEETSVADEQGPLQCFVTDEEGVPLVGSTADAGK